MDVVKEELKFLEKFKKKKLGGGGQVGVGLVGGGVRVDVNEELKFLGKLKKMGGGVGWGSGSGSGW